MNRKTTALTAAAVAAAGFVLSTGSAVASAAPRITDHVQLQAAIAHAASTVTAEQLALGPTGPAGKPAAVEVG